MDRRDFFRSLGAAAGSLWLPHEPRRVYSFGRELRVPGHDGATVTWTVGGADGLSVVVRDRGQSITIPMREGDTVTLVSARIEVPTRGRILYLS